VKLMTMKSEYSAKGDIVQLKQQQTPPSIDNYHSRNSGAQFNGVVLRPAGFFRQVTLDRKTKGTTAVSWAPQEFIAPMNVVTAA